MHWCNFCRVYHSSVSCFHPANRSGSTEAMPWQSQCSFDQLRDEPCPMCDKDNPQATASDRTEPIE